MTRVVIISKHFKRKWINCKRKERGCCYFCARFSNKLRVKIGKKELRTQNTSTSIAIYIASRNLTTFKRVFIRPRCLFFSAACCAATICIYPDQCGSIIIKVRKTRHKLMTLNLLIVEDYVGPPYVIGRHVQHVNTAVLLRLPS